MKRSELWLRCRPADGTHSLRLFCLPHAGGAATAFHSWSAALPPSVQVCSVALPGRGTRFSDPSYTDLDRLVDAIAAELTPWLDIPYAIFGHSMGALLAFEWVRRLSRQGHRMPVWLFLSGRGAPDVQPETSPLHPLPDNEFLKELDSRYQGIPQELMQHPELMDVFLPVLRADLAVVESYRFQPDAPLNCPLTVSAGFNDRSVTYDQMLAWKNHTSCGFKMNLFPGPHFYPQEPLLKMVKETLAPWSNPAS